VPDATCAHIDEMDAIEGVLEGLKFHHARAALGVSSFGISIVDMDPNATEYPEHDHSPEGIGGKMFSKRPAQLGQEEVYVALQGSGEVEVEGERYPLDADHLVRVGPGAKRKVYAGDDGLRLLALGGTPGEPYEPADMQRPS
jgi:mannose-6-phosphate isomerase-like protein (cupin superfamily)